MGLDYAPSEYRALLISEPRAVYMFDTSPPKTTPKEQTKATRDVAGKSFQEHFDEAADSVSRTPEVENRPLDKLIDNMR